MVLTQKQEEGLKIAVDRHKAGERYTVISGYAGTGKSTLVKYIIAALDVDPYRVCYATFTGKAAEVLRKKGNKNAFTLHRLLYEHIPRPGGGFFRKVKPRIEYDIVVVDEVSMVPKEMIDLLFGHRCYVICLGDPFQIPPIDKDTDNHLLDNPHIFLDEIMRQSEESEIIRLSMDIRERKPLQLFDGENVKVVDRKDCVSGMLTWADQIITAKNNTRTMFNNQMRQILGRGPYPQDGDKVVCLRNYWEDLSMEGDALVNGTIGYLHLPQEKIITFPRFTKVSVSSIRALESDVYTDSGDFYPMVTIDENMIRTNQATLDWRDTYKLGRLRQRIGDIIPREMAYGYAITGHKAQGSEWDKVLVYEENFPFNEEEHARWLYTCITRASNKLVLVRQ